MAKPPSDFKVLIAGGSLVGLTLAVILERVGIDFLVLEKGDIGPDLGASISILPQTARVLEQLGLWATILAKGFPMSERHHIDEHGRVHETSYEFGLIAERLGRPCLMIERTIWKRTLYESLQDRSKVRTRVGVASFVEDGEGVTVTTSAGEEIRGSVLVGADGVHSTVRWGMAEAVRESDPKRARHLREGTFLLENTGVSLGVIRREDANDIVDRTCSVHLQLQVHCGEVKEPPRRELRHDDHPTSGNTHLLLPRCIWNQRREWRRPYLLVPVQEGGRHNANATHAPLHRRRHRGRHSREW